MKSRIYNLWFIFSLLFATGPLLRAQELRAEVFVDAAAVNTANRSIFKTLQKSVADFLNNTSWTGLQLKEHEKIKARFLFTIREYRQNRFVCRLTVSAYRPVYNSTYETPVLMAVDKNISFKYIEYQPLTFNEDFIDNNLTAVLAYYAYMIIGYDFDSFRLNGGEKYFMRASEIRAMAAGQGLPGWDDKGKFFSRARWVNQLLDPNNGNFHKAFYIYHRQGLDYFADDPVKAKKGIARALRLLSRLNTKRSDILIKLFFDTKSDEIVQVFSSGPALPEVRDIKRILTDLAPAYAYKWEKIKL